MEDGPVGQDRKSTRLNSSHTVIYTLSLHDALPISSRRPTTTSSRPLARQVRRAPTTILAGAHGRWACGPRSEEHTSELQSHSDLHSFPTRRSSDLLPKADDHVIAAVSKTGQTSAHDHTRRRSWKMGLWA